MRERRVRRFSVGRFSVAVAVLVFACSALSSERYPVQGMMPQLETEDGLIAIPGAPLPPVPKESLRDAIPIYTAILALARPVSSWRAVARGRGFLATLYAAIGEYAKAEQLFGEALRTFERKGVKAGEDLGWVHNNRGLVQLRQDRYTDALRSFRAALAALHGTGLVEPRAKALQNVASAYHLVGDVELSESAYLDALAVLRASGKERGSEADVIRANLAILYVSLRDYAQARAILQELAERSTSSPSMRLAVLNNLGYVLYALNDFRGAEARLDQALPLTATGSKERVPVLTNLAAARALAGNYAAAERDGREALRIAVELYGGSSHPAAAIMGTLGTAALAHGDLETSEKLLGRAAAILAASRGEQDALAGILQELALVAQRRGSHERAVELSRKALDLEKKNLARILAFGSEAQRLAYRSNASPYDQLANLGDATLLADAVLAAKGAVLESLLAERAQIRKTRSPVDQQRVKRIQSLKIRRMEMIARGETDRDALERDLKREETVLARSSRSGAPRVDPSAVSVGKVQAVLAPDQVLIEIIRYQRYVKDGRLVPWYGAIVIPHRGSPQWTPLSPADVVDALVGNLTQRLDVAPRFGGATRSFEPSDGLKNVVQTLRELHAQLWKPLPKMFAAGTGRVLLSPDGATHFIPWAALLDERERFLVERWQLAQVGSGRDLLRESTASKDRTVLMFADALNDLPGSRREVDRLDTAARRQRWHPLVFVGDAAKEALLSRYPSPRILILATHGGQIGEGRPHAVETRLSGNAMYRGALLLSGGARTLEAWANGTVFPFADDGVLTAEEAAGLPLGGTWLTVLSACRSGAGDARIGEGVLGLRRGFALAGTENLLFSLWSVRDDATAVFMEESCNRLFHDEDLSLAFHETQKAALRQWKKVGGVQEAVSRAGAFVLTK